MRLIWLAALAVVSTPVMAQGMYGQQQPYGYQPRQPSPGMYGGYGTGSNPQSEAVQGYTNRNGTYVPPYERTVPNSTQMDNYGTRGNVNPYTGAYGTRSPRY